MHPPNMPVVVVPPSELPPELRAASLGACPGPRLGRCSAFAVVTAAAGERVVRAVIGSLRVGIPETPRQLRCKFLCLCNLTLAVRHRKPCVIRRTKPGCHMQYPFHPKNSHRMSSGLETIRGTARGG